MISQITLLMRELEQLGHLLSGPCMHSSACHHFCLNRVDDKVLWMHSIWRENNYFSCFKMFCFQIETLSGIRSLILIFLVCEGSSESLWNGGRWLWCDAVLKSMHSFIIASIHLLKLLYISVLILFLLSTSEKKSMKELKSLCWWFLLDSFAKDCHWYFGFSH